MGNVKTTAKPTVSSVSEYAYWKILAWRFLRTGLSGGITSLLAVQVALHPDFSNTKVVLYTAGSAFITGFISTAGLALRDYLSQGDKDSAIQKLPL